MNDTMSDSEKTMRALLETVLANHQRRLAVYSKAVPTVATMLAARALETNDAVRYIGKVAHEGPPPWDYVANEFRMAEGMESVFAKPKRTAARSAGFYRPGARKTSAKAPVTAKQALLKI